MRVQVPPPKSMVSGNSAGWNRDSPESASRMKQMPVTQWLARLGGGVALQIMRIVIIFRLQFTLDFGFDLPWTPRSGPSHVVEQAAQRRRPCRPSRGVWRPFHRVTVGAIVGSVGRPLYSARLVGVVEHVHDVGAAHAGRVVQAGVLEAAFLELGDALVGQPCMSTLEPKLMLPVGQTLTHAGLSPTATRSEHSVHL